MHITGVYKPLQVGERLARTGWHGQRYLQDTVLPAVGPVSNPRRVTLVFFSDGEVAIWSPTDEEAAATDWEIVSG